MAREKLSQATRRSRDLDGSMARRYGCSMDKTDISASMTGGPLTTLHENAVILPSTKHWSRNNYAVIDRDGAIIPHADTWRAARMNNPEGRIVSQDVDELAGTHLFGGMIFYHFGHVFVESTARLHAYPALKDQIDSVVFVGFSSSQTEVGRHRVIFETLGVDAPLRVISQPTRIERLYVPRQLGGLGRHAAGGPALHRFFAEASARIAPDGPDRIFISRAGYSLNRGGVISEDLLEANMEAQGYTLYAPERHSLAEQIAAYRAARVVVGLDSSAFHVVAAASNRNLETGIILRRRSGTVDIAPQIEGFTGRKPVIIDAIRRMWACEGARARPWDHFAEIDFAEVAEQLETGGFLTDPAAWRIANPGIRTRFRRRYAKAKGKALAITDREL
ncbi:MAG: glycosyltransferase family 61 protein [Paracoccaceae bacterium]